MSTWDEIKKKIQDLEKDPLMDADMLRTMDTISIADYWRRRFEEEHALSERKIGGKDEEIHQLQERVERQGMELKLVHQELDAARTELMDKQRFWEERHHTLELENRGLKDRMDYEVKSRVLEEQNRFLADRLKRGAPADEDGGEVVGRAQKKDLEDLRARAETASRESQDLRSQLAAYQNEKQRWEEERQRLSSLASEAEALKKARAELEEKLQSLASSSSPMAEENTRLKKEAEPLRQKLLQHKKRLERREKEHLQALEDLGRGFAHRVRNYLGIMSGTLQLCLANYKMEPDLQEQVNLVDQNAQEMLKAIEEFLSLVRVPEMNMEAVDLNKFLQRTLVALEDKAKTSNVKFQWALSENLPPVLGDSRLLAEAVSALASNALDAMSEGGRLTIETAFSEAENTVKILFRDTGKGINENHVRKVFQPYFSTRKGYKGLGLTVCKRVMELHSGTVALESVKNEGTTATLSLPAQESAEESAGQKNI